MAASVLASSVVIHVPQRRRQIGALRAFGAGRAAVFAIVWGEVALIALSGVAAGFALGYGACAGHSAAAGGERPAPAGGVRALRSRRRWPSPRRRLFALLPAHRLPVTAGGGGGDRARPP